MSICSLNNRKAPLSSWAWEPAMQFLKSRKIIIHKGHFMLEASFFNMGEREIWILEKATYSADDKNPNPWRRPGEGGWSGRVPKTSIFSIHFYWVLLKLGKGDSSFHYIFSMYRQVASPFPHYIYRKLNYHGFCLK